MRHPVQETRGSGRARAPGLIVIPTTRDNTANQRGRQQRENRDKPRGLEDVEKLQRIVDLGELAVVRDIFVDVVLIQRTLRQ